MDTSLPRPDVDHPRVDVVVPIYGGWPFVERCLLALERQTVPVSVIVVDDASPDDVANEVSRRFPHVRLLRNDTNLGFARSCNRGIDAGSGDVVILVNSDVEAEAEMAERIAQALGATGDSHEAGSASPLLLQPDGRVDAFGVTADITLAGFVRFHGADVASAVVGDAPAIIGPYGALAGYRRAALDEVGVLDENFFMYGEELELAFRLANAGWTTVMIDTPLGTHMGGASAGPGSPRQRYLSGFGRGYTLRRYDVLRTKYALRAVATELIVIALGLLRHRDVAQLRGRIDGWRKARGLSKRARPLAHLDASIGFLESLRMRSANYWTSRR